LNIKILDCTLRDGGYVNDWGFLNHQIINIVKSLEKSGVEVIECGYLNDRKGHGCDSTLFKDVDTFLSIVGELDTDAQKVVMINLGDFTIDALPKSDTNKIDGIRLAFHKKDLNEAIEYAKEVQKLGYKLYFQPMVTKNYTDLEFLSLIEKVNKLNPYAFYIVDSFGSMTLNEFQKYIILSDSNLKSTISLGYHSHNNMQLAFSNAISMCNMNIKRQIIVDSSIYGIGRGAGNLNTELITDYLNTTYNKNYNTLPLLEIIDTFLNSLMQTNPWGFSPAQYLSASFNCHPNYATYLINKNTKHIVGVKKVLQKIPNESKSSFDKVLIEKLYIESLLETKTKMYGEIDLPSNKKILLIASGKSVKKYKETILKKVNGGKYIVVALNHKPEFECDYYFFSNQKRFDEFSKDISHRKVVITSNVYTLLNVFAVFDIKSLVYIDSTFVTNVAIVFLNYLILQSIKEVEIAGLDGYKINEDNYNYKETSIINDDKELLEQNKIIKKSIDNLSAKIKLDFITPSIFKWD